VASTVSANGRATFNQVTQLRAPNPDEIVLAAVVPSEGIYVWRHAHTDVDAHAHDQHTGYSRQLGPIDTKNPPAWLGAPEIVPIDDIDPTLWRKITTTARTNTLKKSVAKALAL
jgi:hypothetical protein